MKEQKQTTPVQKENTIKYTDNQNKIFYEAENEILNDERKSRTYSNIKEGRSNNN